MNKHLFAGAVAFLILLQWVHAQGKPALADAPKLTVALANLRKNPDDPTAQQRYLYSFPNTYARFLQLFEPGRQLYDGFEYISVLPSLAGKDEKGVGELLIRLSKDAHYEADAPSYLQDATAAYASQHTKMFVELVNELPIEKRAHLIVFLADVENHSAYPHYQETIDHLNDLGERCLAEEFRIAREQRQRQPHK